MDAGERAVGHLVAVSHTGLASGAEGVLLRAMAMARSGGWTVECLAPPGPFTERALAGGFSVAPIPDLKLPQMPRLLGMGVVAWRSVQAAAQIRRAARRADAVLLNGIFGLPALRLAHTSTPSAWLVHDVIHRRSWLALLRATGRSADLAVAVSEAVAEPLRHQGLETTVIRNGTTWPVEPAHAERAGPPVIGCTALLTPWKGQHVLLDAVALLDDPDVTVELLGGRFPKDADYVRSLEARAGRSDLAGKVRFLGHVADPMAQMRTWTVAVLPSVDPEAGPLALLEYMSLGLAVVATNHGGTPEVIDGAGVLVPPRDPDAMAAALADLLADPGRRDACATAGRAAIAGALTLDHQRTALLEMLDVLSGRPARDRPGRRRRPSPER